MFPNQIFWNELNWFLLPKKGNFYYYEIIFSGILKPFLCYLLNLISTNYSFRVAYLDRKWWFFAFQKVYPSHGVIVQHPLGTHGYFWLRLYIAGWQINCLCGLTPHLFGTFHSAMIETMKKFRRPIVSSAFILCCHIWFFHNIHWVILN